MIKGLLERYGSLKDIPEDDLVSIGFQRVTVDGSVRVIRQGSASKAFLSLRE
ncbi:MAG: hypothetical protein V1745_03690 [Patescibacteria group bacterium]